MSAKTQVVHGKLPLLNLRHQNAEAPRHEAPGLSTTVTTVGANQP